MPHRCTTFTAWNERGPNVPLPEASCCYRWPSIASSSPPVWHYHAQNGTSQSRSGDTVQPLACKSRMLAEHGIPHHTCLLGSVCIIVPCQHMQPIEKWKMTYWVGTNLRSGTHWLTFHSEIGLRVALARMPGELARADRPGVDGSLDVLFIGL